MRWSTWVVAAAMVLPALLAPGAGRGEPVGAAMPAAEEPPVLVQAPLPPGVRDVAAAAATLPPPDPLPHDVVQAALGREDAPAPGPDLAPVTTALDEALASPFGLLGPAAFDLCWEAPAVQPQPRCTAAPLGLPQALDLTGDGAPDATASLGFAAALVGTAAHLRVPPGGPAGNLAAAAPPLRFEVEVTDPAQRGALPAHVYFVYDLPHFRRVAAGFDGRASSLADASRLDAAVGLAWPVGSSLQPCDGPVGSVRLLLGVNHIGARSPAALTFAVEDPGGATPPVVGAFRFAEVPAELTVDGRFHADEVTTLAFDLAASTAARVDGRIVLGDGPAAETVELGLEPLPSPAALRLVHDPAGPGRLGVCFDAPGGVRAATLRHHVLRDGEPRVLDLAGAEVPAFITLEVEGVGPAAEDLHLAYEASSALDRLKVAYRRGLDDAAHHHRTTLEAGPLPTQLDVRLGGILAGNLTLAYRADHTLPEVIVTHLERHAGEHPALRRVFAYAEDVPPSVDLSMQGASVTFDASEPLADALVVFVQNQGRLDPLDPLGCCDEVWVEVDDPEGVVPGDEHLGAWARLHHLKSAVVDHPAEGARTYGLTLGAGGQPFDARVRLRNATQDLALAARLEAMPDRLELSVDPVAGAYGYAASGRLPGLKLCLDSVSGAWPPTRQLMPTMLTREGCLEGPVEAEGELARVWADTEDLPSRLALTVSVAPTNRTIVYDTPTGEPPLGAATLALRTAGDGRDARLALATSLLPRHVEVVVGTSEQDGATNLSLALASSGAAGPPPGGVVLDGDLRDRSIEPATRTAFSLTLGALPARAAVAVSDASPGRLDASVEVSDRLPATLRLYTGAEAALHATPELPMPRSGVSIRDGTGPQDAAGTRIALAVPGAPAGFRLGLASGTMPCSWAGQATTLPTTELDLAVRELVTGGPFEVDLALQRPAEQPVLQATLAPDAPAVNLSLLAELHPRANALCGVEGLDAVLDLTTSSTGRLRLFAESTRHPSPFLPAYSVPPVPVRGAVELHAALPTRLDATIGVRANALHRDVPQEVGVQIQDDQVTLDLRTVAGMACPDAPPFPDPGEDRGHRTVLGQPSTDCLHLQWGAVHAGALNREGSVQLRDLPSAMRLDYHRRASGLDEGDLTVSYRAGQDGLDVHFELWRFSPEQRFDPLTLTATDVTNEFDAFVNVIVSSENEGVGAEVEILTNGRADGRAIGQLELSLRGTVLTRGAVGRNPYGDAIITQTWLELREPMVMRIRDVKSFQLATGTVLTLGGDYASFDLQLPGSDRPAEGKRCVSELFADHSIERTWEYCHHRAADPGLRYQQRFDGDEPFVLCIWVFLQSGGGVQANLCVTQVVWYAAADHANDWCGRPHQHADATRINRLSLETPGAHASRWFAALNPDSYAEDWVYASPGDPGSNAKGPEGGIWIYNAPGIGVEDWPSQYYTETVLGAIPCVP